MLDRLIATNERYQVYLQDRQASLALFREMLIAQAPQVNIAPPVNPAPNVPVAVDDLDLDGSVRSAEQGYGGSDDTYHVS